MFKKSISEEFLRSLDKPLISPLLGDKGDQYGAALMYKSLDQMRASPELRSRLASIVEDARKFFPDFQFDKVPFYWLIKNSKAKNSTIIIKDETGKETPIFIIRQIKDESAILGYDYIDLNDGKLVYARSKNAIGHVTDGINRNKTEKLAILTSINTATNLLLREKEDYSRNERMLRYQRGDVSNLVSAIPMLERCVKILDQRIFRLQSIVNYYKNVKEQPTPVVFKSVKEIVQNEIDRSGSSYIKTHTDLINALIMRYIDKLEEFEMKYKSGELKKQIESNKKVEMHQADKVLEIVSKIIKAIKEEKERNKERNKKETQERKEQPKNVPDYPDTQSHPIFSVFPPLSEETFKDKLPGGPAGYMSEETWQSEKDAIIISTEEIKLNFMITIKQAAQKIIEIFKRKRETSSLSVSNFTPEDMKSLKKAFDDCMTMIRSYKQSVLTKEKKINKNMIGSIFEETALDFFTSRYIATIIVYIEMVFAKHNRSST